MIFWGVGDNDLFKINLKSMRYEWLKNSWGYSRSRYELGNRRVIVTHFSCVTILAVVVWLNVSQLQCRWVTGQLRANELHGGFSWQWWWVPVCAWAIASCGTLPLSWNVIIARLDCCTFCALNCLISIILWPLLWCRWRECAGCTLGMEHHWRIRMRAAPRGVSVVIVVLRLIAVWGR